MSVKKLTPADVRKCEEGATGIAEVISERWYFAMDQGRQLYRYSDGRYQSDGEAFICRQVKNILRVCGISKKWSSRKAKEVAEYIRADARALWQEPRIDVINVKNGLLDWKQRKLLRHTPDHLSTLQLPVEYDPTAACPAWDRFVQSTFPEDAHEVAYEIVAWLMVPYRGLQKALLLVGDGSNGKSTFLRALSAFLGSEHICAVTLHRLESDRFATARLIGKLANICPDLPNKKLETTSIFKAITGGDPVMAEHKFGDSFDIKPFARLVFSANELPRSSDSSEGFYRRLIILPFNKIFPANPELGRELDEELSDPRELSGVLNRALAVLSRVLRQGIAIAPSMQGAQEEYRAATDPLQVWLDTETVEDSEGWLPKRALWEAYRDDCVLASGIPASQVYFGRRLKALRRSIRDAQKAVDGRLTWGYAGIRFREDSLHGIH